MQPPVEPVKAARKDAPNKYGCVVQHSQIGEQQQQQQAAAAAVADKKVEKENQFWANHRASARTAPAGGTVRPPSPPYGFQPVPPPVLPVPSPQRMPSIPLDAMDPSMGTFGTTIAPPDEPTPLDVDHLERTRFSPPHDPFAPSDGESMFEGRPSFDPSGTPDGSAAGGGFY